MMTTATHDKHYNAPKRVLFVAWELRETSWKPGCTTGHGHKPRERTTPARDPKRLLEGVMHARRHFGLPETALVVRCDEAGRAGFWLHRFLQAQGSTNSVVDSSSIAVNRRRRRAKSDALDGRKLLTILMRYHHGECAGWHVVHVPSVEVEEQRHLHRDIEALKRERMRTSNRIKSLLRSQGLRSSRVTQLPQQLKQLRLWDGSMIPSGLRRRLRRVYAHYNTFLGQQLATLAAARRAILRTSQEATIEQVRQLMQRTGIGINGSWMFVMELFGWRQCKNHREVGALAGLTPTPYHSGESSRAQGITQAGKRRIRWMATEWAWGWVRSQPESTLSRWCKARFDTGGSRLRRIGIVAVARKLLMALWRFLETGVLPEGAVLKAT